MKIRIGFVSNSSSSSFVIATKGLTKAEMKSKVKSLLKIDLPKNHPIKELPNVGDDLPDYIDDTYTSKDINKWRQQYDLEVGEADPIIDRLEAGWTVYTGSVCDEEFEEILLCNTEIKYEDDNLFIEKEAGY